MKDYNSMISRRGFMKVGAVTVAGLAIAPNELSGRGVIPDHQDIAAGDNKHYHASFDDQRDKAYDPSNYSGKGCVVLKQNMVRGVNTLTQDMFCKGEADNRVPNDNTIYVIQYDFTISTNIVIPDNSVLMFEGGTINGLYTLTGTNTTINADIVRIFNEKITLAGTWNVAEAYPEWFGAVGNGVNDDIQSIQRCIDFSLKLHIPTVLNKSYYISSPIMINNGLDKMYGSRDFRIIGNDALITFADKCFDSTIKGDSCVAGGVFVKGVFFTSKSNDKYVLTKKLFRVTFDDCVFNTPLLTTDSYIQTIYLTNCNISKYTREFIITSGGCHNLVLDCCRVDGAFHSLISLNSTTEQGVDFVVTNCLMQGIRNHPAIYLLKNGSGVVSNCYFEGNRKGDIYGYDNGGATNNLRIVNNVFLGNLPENGEKVYSISWWGTKNSMSVGNVGLNGPYGHRFRTPPTDFYINDAGYEYNSYNVRGGLPSVRNNANKLFTGMMVFDTNDNKLKVYTGTNWSVI